MCDLIRYMYSSLQARRPSGTWLLKAQVQSLDPSVIKVPSVMTFGPKRNKSPIRNNILNPSVIKVLSVITFGPSVIKIIKV